MLKWADKCKLTQHLLFGSRQCIMARLPPHPSHLAIQAPTPAALMVKGAKDDILKELTNGPLCTLCHNSSSRQFSPGCSLIELNFNFNLNCGWVWPSDHIWTLE